MISHRQVMVNAATAVKNSTDILSACQESFGRGLQIVVGAYAGAEDGSGIPGEADSPFLWCYSAGENEEVAAEMGFTMHCVVGGCVKGEHGERKISAADTPRTETANGLTVNGGNKVVEDLRDDIIAEIEKSLPGAIINRIRRTENDLSHFPLEWAEFEVDFIEPDNL